MPRPSLPVTSLLPLVLTALPAQRGQASIKNAAFECSVDYGQPPWGKHSLDELPVGQSWRLGMGEATAWRTQAPIMVGSTLIAPGVYRVALQRSGENDFAVTFVSSGLALGGTDTAGLACKLAKDEVAKKLGIELRKADAKAAAKGAGPRPDADLATQVRIRFGPHRIEGDFALVGGRELGATPKFRLIGWALPAQLVQEMLAAGKAVPVLTFLPVAKLRHQDPQAFNVLVSNEKAELVPGLVMPEASFGFADTAPPLADWRRPAEITWGEAAQPTEHVEFSDKAERKGKRYELELRCGKRTATVKVAEPEAKG